MSAYLMLLSSYGVTGYTRIIGAVACSPGWMAITVDDNLPKPLNGSLIPCPSDMVGLLPYTISGVY